MRGERRNLWRNGWGNRFGRRLLPFLLVLAALILLPQEKAQAAGTENFANLVIFVKYRGDT